jgi:hypothetical protein
VLALAEGGLCAALRTYSIGHRPTLHQSSAAAAIDRDKQDQVIGKMILELNLPGVRAAERVLVTGPQYRPGPARENSALRATSPGRE